MEKIEASTMRLQMNYERVCAYSQPKKVTRKIAGGVVSTSFYQKT